MKFQSPADTKILLIFGVKEKLRLWGANACSGISVCKRTSVKGGRVSLSIPQGESLFVMRTPLRFSKTWNDTSPLGYLKLSNDTAAKMFDRW